VVKKLNVRKYNHDQIVDALLCPLNRFATMVEHSCNEYDLHKHPEWLLEHYVRCGGAVYWASKREQYMEEKQDELEKQKKEIPLGEGEDYTSGPT
jgi:hypothetical protein